MKKLLPPVLFALFSCAIFALDSLWAGDWVRPLIAPYHHAGWLPLLLGVVLLACARMQFARARTNIYTFDEPGSLVTSGVFAISRHPMYLGFTSVLFGLALLLGSGLGLLLAGCFAFIVDHWYIAFEEQWLRSKFGAAYEAYVRRTRRWF